MKQNSSKTKRVVVFFNGKASLLLSKITRNMDSSLKSGYVVNGDWTATIKDGFVCTSCQDGYKFLLPLDVLEVEVPDDMQGDYNEIMYWAKQSLNKLRLECS
jgi:hypothetical protein